MLGVVIAGEVFVLPLRLGQVAQKLAQFGVAGLLGGAGVESLRLQLHQRHLLADPLHVPGAQRLQRIAAHEALHVLPAHQRDLLAELCTEQVHQPVPVPVFLLAETVQGLGRLGIVRPQQAGELLVDAAVFLLQRNGQGQYLRALRSLN